LPNRLLDRWRRGLLARKNRGFRPHCMILKFRCVIDVFYGLCEFVALSGVRLPNGARPLRCISYSRGKIPILHTQLNSKRCSGKVFIDMRGQRGSAFLVLTHQCTTNDIFCHSLTYNSKINMIGSGWGGWGTCRQKSETKQQK
jgi:hypothetical protein